MSFVLTKGIDDEDATEFAYVACAYACVARENQALGNQERIPLRPLGTSCYSLQREVIDQPRSTFLACDAVQ